MLRMRLMRRGAKKHPFYDIVVMESWRARESKYVDKVGFYDPMADKTSDMRFRCDAEKVKKHMSVGVQLSDRVTFLLKKAGVLV